MSHLAAMTLRCTARGPVPFLVLETKGKGKKWLSNWSSSSQNIWYRESYGWSTGSMHWGVCRCCGGGYLKFWGGIYGDVCPWLHDDGECFTHQVCRTHTRLGWGREEPGNEPHWISLTQLREDLPAGGVHLFSHPDPFVLLLLNHPELLVLIIFGQPCQFEGQPHSSWALAWVASCKCLKARLKLSVLQFAWSCLYWNGRRQLGPTMAKESERQCYSS